MKFIIGTSDSKNVKVDALVLADTRALINASSGLGKSWLMRLIAENVASSIQTIIVDPEGEFSTLREKLDILIDHYPYPVNREELAEAAGYTVKSTSFTNPLGALRSLGVIDYPNSIEAIALPVLFSEK